MSQYSQEEKYAVVNLNSEEYAMNYPHRGPRAWASMRYRLKQTGEFDRLYDPELEGVYVESDDKPVPPTVTGITGVQVAEKPDVESILARHRETFRKARELEVRKRNQEITISHAPAMIALVSDVHIGSPGTDIERVFREQELINNCPGAYAFLLGDIADNFLVGRLRDINMGHDITIPEEFYLVEEYYKRWENLLAVVGGNHDAFSRSVVGLDVHRKLLGEHTALYDTDDLRLTLNVGDHKIKFRLRHQYLGRSQYSATHGAEKSVKFDDPDPDILVSGHTHNGALSREFLHAGKRKIAIQLGTYKIFDDFATKVGFPGNDSSTAAAVIIMPNGRYMATGSLEAAVEYMEGVYGRRAA